MTLSDTMDLQPTIIRLPITSDLQRYGVTRLDKDGTSIFITINETPIIFTLGKGIFSTLQNFKDNTKGKIEDQLQEAIIFLLSDGDYPSLIQGPHYKVKSVDSRLSRPTPTEPEPTTIEDKDENKNDIEEINRVITVSEALRRHKGPVKVQGMIIGYSQLFKMVGAENYNCNNCGASDKKTYEKPLLVIPPLKNKHTKCPSCGNQDLHVDYDFINAITIELQDLDKFTEIERLHAILFDNDTSDIVVGEQVIVDGQVHIIQQNRSGKSFSYIYVKSIKYEQREEVNLSRYDKEAIERFAKIKGSKVIDELVLMFARSVIGYDDVKKGLLLCAVNTGIDTQGQRNRMHALLVGEPGLAKSGLLREAVKLVPNSRYESAQNSSGKSLTAIVSKEDESYVLRSGPIPLSKGAFCGLNEIGRVNFEDQAHLLDAMEEGQFTINKHGINARIQSSTSIIGSANPIGGTWNDDTRINLDEIPAMKPIVDRFDLLFVFRKSRDKEAITEYAIRKSQLDGKRMPDYYNFLRKYILYGKTVNPILSDEAKVMLNEYYIEIAEKTDFGSPRIQQTLFRLAKSIARLQLKKVADAEDAKMTTEFYNIILEQHDQVVSIPNDPRDIIFSECVVILRKSKQPTTYEELIKMASQRDKQIENYIGNDFKLRNNFKLRPILDMLLNHGCIKQIQQKPVVLQWIEQTTSNNGDKNRIENDLRCDACDACDACDEVKKDEKSKTKVDNSNNYEHPFVSSTHTSHTSHSLGLLHINKEGMEEVDGLGPGNQSNITTKQAVADFYDKPNTHSKSLPAHSLVESPCYPVISKHDKFYYCRLHPNTPYLYLEAIEHHCKYHETAKHKEEILKSISATALAAQDKPIATNVTTNNRDEQIS